jgi:hypothetical protein
MPKTFWQRHLWKFCARVPAAPFLNFIFIYDGSSVVLHREQTAQLCDHFPTQETAMRRTILMAIILLDVTPANA